MSTAVLHLLNFNLNDSLNAIISAKDGSTRHSYRLKSLFAQVFNCSLCNFRQMKAQYPAAKIRTAI